MGLQAWKVSMTSPQNLWDKETYCVSISVFTCEISFDITSFYCISGKSFFYYKDCEACGLLDLIQSFDFVFNLHLMKNMLGITSELSLALQKWDQDIVNAMALVKIAKHRLQTMRDDR